ncbi:MAG: diguanylate cyclase [Oscillospiraceae bacterium]|nr:diguanylate cyclase [Oscillospiraceae bacterium]
MLYNLEEIWYDNAELEVSEEVSFLESGRREKYKILIADDSEMNRSILADMLENEYEILEAENGKQALEIIGGCQQTLSLVLLDIVMPELDGFGVLEAMNHQGSIADIPVIMISSESSASCVERAYELGATDFISRPFDALIVRRRVDNTILLYAKQKKLMGLAARQIYEKERQSRLMIEILSHVVEFRNGESGQHIRRVRFLTELLLRHLNRRGDYRFSQQEIGTISIASALHDIGKIAIPEEVLNKPGRLTEAEFTVMKTHSQIGAQMLDNLPVHQEDPLIKTAYEICRWHHERYDGGGYPDGLKGGDIPIAAQIVALADVYDALTSDRVYKKALSHETAVQMILDGQCGAFSPLLLSCLEEVADTLKERLAEDTFSDDPLRLRGIVEELLKREELSASGRTLRLLEHERMKYDSFAALSGEIQFEYTSSPGTLVLSPSSAGRLALPEVILNPTQNENLLALVSKPEMERLGAMLLATTPAKPEVECDCKFRLAGEERWFHVICRATWSEEEPSRYIGAIGKAMDIHDSRLKTDDLERMAFTDQLTGLLNHASAQRQIAARLAEKPKGKFALVIFDLDDFKSANDTFGHQFGDEVLIQTAQRLRKSTRSDDIVARVGGDEYLLFLEYKAQPEPTIRRIFSALCFRCKDFTISVSFGVALTETVGYDYNALLQAADKALYTVKRGGGGQYRFYDGAMQDTFSVISPIEEAGEGKSRKTRRSKL